MPLIDLKTNLKDLKFGHDEYKGGSSQQPFIQTAVPATDQPLQTGASISGDNILQGVGSIALSAGGGALVGGIFGGGTGAVIGAAVGGTAGIIGTSNLITGDIDYASLKLPRSGTGGTDFLIRGGTLAANIVVDDVERLTKFFGTPNGALFTTKQGLLSRIAVKTQASGRLFNGGQYNPLGTLAQAGGNILGLHVNKQGLNPFSGLGEAYVPNQYFDVVKPTLGDTKVNRLYQLYSRKILNQNTVLSTFNNISLNPNLLFSYSGGPDSNIGVGNTNIKFATDNTGAIVKTSDAANSTTLSPQQIEGVGSLNDTLREIPSSPPKITDFRLFLRLGTATSTILSNSPSYDGDKILEVRTGLGDPGSQNQKNIRSYTNGYLGEVNKSFGAASPNSYDKINAYPLYQSEYPVPPAYDDLISFRIGIINNDKPELKTYIHFRAFLDSISDQYKADWKGTKYLGRGEDFYTYGGFDRSVSLSWTVAAQSKAELIPMYKKLNYLASICMPDYNAFGYMRGNMVTLTIGGYFYEQPGIITGFSYNMNEDNATWEIGINDEGDIDDSVRQVPHLIKITGFNFIPIHNFVPRKQQNLFNNSVSGEGFVSLYGRERYISLENVNSDESNNFYNNSLSQDQALRNSNGLPQQSTPPEPPVLGNPSIPGIDISQIA